MKTSAIFYHAGCPVCIEAEHQVAEALDLARYDVKIVHLGEQKDQISVDHLKILKKGLDVELLNGDILSYLDYTLPPKSILSYAYCSDTAPFAKLPE